MSNMILNKQIFDKELLLAKERVLDELENYKLIQINDIFCIPKKEEIVRSKRNNQVKQINRIYYPVKVSLENSNTICYLRSFGEDFNLVLFEWVDLKEVPKGYFSIGKGIDNGTEVKNLLLAQFFGDPEYLIDINIQLSNQLKQSCKKYITAMDSLYDLPCLKVSAII